MPWRRSENLRTSSWELDVGLTGDRLWTELLTDFCAGCIWPTFCYKWPTRNRRRSHERISIGVNQMSVGHVRVGHLRQNRRGGSGPCVMRKIVRSRHERSDVSPVTCSAWEDRRGGGNWTRGKVRKMYMWNSRMRGNVCARASVCVFEILRRDVGISRRVFVGSVIQSRPMWGLC